MRRLLSSPAYSDIAMWFRGSGLRGPAFRAAVLALTFVVLILPASPMSAVLIPRQISCARINRVISVVTAPWLRKDQRRFQ